MVITIIAVLASLLIPVVGMVRGAAKNTQCAQNLRTLTLAMHAYCNDNDGILPYFDGNEPGWPDWANRIFPFVDSLAVVSYTSKNPFRCPLTVEELNGRWATFYDLANMYSMNWYLRAWWQNGVLNHGTQFTPLSKTRANQVLLADGTILRNGPGQPLYWYSTQSGKWPDWNGPPWPVGGSSMFDDATPANTSAIPIVRHRGRVNQSFIDGHVAPVSGFWDKDAEYAKYLFPVP